jgi:hypothetical protein
MITEPVPAPITIRCSAPDASAMAWAAIDRSAPVVLLADGNPAVAGRLAAELVASGGRVVVMVGSPEDPAVAAVLEQLTLELLPPE